MLCGRGTRKFAFDTDHEIDPPYAVHEVDLVALTGTKAQGYLFNTILSNTIGKLGHYSEIVQSIIRELPDGILSIEAFPGAGKTTVAAAIDALLCLLSDKFKILVIAGQNAALDALNNSIDDRLKSSVPIINKKLSADHSLRPVQCPLVLRAYGSHHSEMMEFVRIVTTGSESGPDRTRPNTLSQLLLQLLEAAEHSLPAFSKSGLTELAASIKSQGSEGFQNLRQFVARDLTWDAANHMPETVGPEGSGLGQDGPRKDTVTSKSEETVSNNKLQPQRTAKNALIEIISHVLPLVNILICSTAAATAKTYKEFVDAADLCQNEEAGATPCYQVFAGWRGIGQPLIISGDGAQFGPHRPSYVSHVFQNYMAISTLDMIKKGGYPIFHLTTQHRAIDGQFDPVYENFYGNFTSIRSLASQHPDNHPDAQRVEAAFVADFPGLQPSPAGRILPMFINVPTSQCEQAKASRQRPNFKKSRHSPEQVRTADYIVKKLTSCDIKPTDIMVIAAYRAEFVELRETIQDDVLVTTADSAQGQECPYVVFAFSVNRDTGPGFTMEPHRLCVAMSRQKKFLAMVGDINTVKHRSRHEDAIYLESIHNYFVRHGRVGTYEKAQQAVQDAALVPDPFTTELRDEEEERLQANLNTAIAALSAATAALNAHKGSKANKPAAQPGTETEPRQQTDQSVTKPKVIQEMEDFMRRAPRPVSKAAVNTGGFWDTSTDTGNSSSGSLNDPDKAGSPAPRNVPDDDNVDSVEQKCQNCGSYGHYTNACAEKNNSVKCYNCSETGHMRRECPKLNQGPKCHNCDEFGHVSRECPKPRDYSRVQCSRCGKFGHTVARCV